MEKKNKEPRFLKKLHNYKEWVIVLTLFAFVISCIYTFFVVTPIYSSSAKILVTEPNSETEELPITPSSTTTTYSHVLTSDVILNPVIEELALDTTPAALREQVTAETVENSEIIALNVEGENPYEASEMANAIAEQFQETIAGSTSTETVQILNAAVPSMDPVHPNHIPNILIGTLLGFLLSLLVVALKRTEDRPETISPEMVKEWTGYRSVGNISRFTEDDYMILKVRPNDNEDDSKEERSNEEESMSRMNRHRL